MKVNLHRLSAVGLFAAMAASPATAAASGFYIGDVGTRGMGRAGAFVAAPDSLLAASYNPAGLSLLRGLHAEVSVAYVELDAEYQRRCPCTDDPATDARLGALFDGRVASTSTPLAIPFIAVGYGFDWLNTHVALAGWGPNSGRHNWGDRPTDTTSELFRRRSEAQPQRYAAFAVANFEANITLNVAMEPLPGLRVGLSGYLAFTGADQSLSVWANSRTLADTPEDTDFDAPLEFRLAPTPSLSWGAGLSYEPITGLSIGTSFRAERNIVGTGKIEASVPPALDPENSRIEGDEVEIELDIAPIWRAGIQYRWPKWFTVEAAVVWEGWSTHDTIFIRPQNVSVVLPVGDPIVIPELELDRDWVDTWSFRLGGEIHPLQPWVDFRWGYFYETSAVPAATVSASRIDRPKHGVSLGAAVTWGGVTVELAASYVHLVPISTRDSDIRVTGVFPTEAEEPGAPIVGSDENLSVIGNGHITAHYLMGAISVSFALDPFLEDDEDEQTASALSAW